jgi:hypothetical protein
MYIALVPSAPARVLSVKIIHYPFSPKSATLTAYGRRYRADRE